MWQSSLTTCTTQKESHDQDNQFTDVRYIWNNEEIIKAFWTLFQHHGVAAFKYSEISPLTPRLFAIVPN
jgi:hypothetical protein